MWSEEEIKIYLSRKLKSDRYNHVLGVVEMAEKLAIRYRADVKKARLAALIHDLAKYEGGETLIKMAKENGYEIDEVEKKAPYLLHGFAAAVIAKKEMGINDEEVLNAAIYHTTGRENMTLLEKIIYIADYIEPNRNYPGVEELRNITFEDLDRGLIKAFDNTIRFVLDKGTLLHFRTIEGRNYLVK